MKDKIKEFRDKNPLLDFFAAFIPGVGEALDVQDFAYAAKDKNFGGMALASMGLLIPGLTGGLFRKLAKFGDDAIGGGVKKIMDEVLPEGLKRNGWKVASDGAFINPNGRRYIRYKGELKAEDLLKDIILAEERKNALKAAKKAARELKKAFDDAVESFKQESGLDFSLENWLSLAPGHRMTDIEKRIYTTEAFPGFVKSYRELTRKGKERLIYDKKTKKWYGWFDESVADGVSDNLPILKLRWNQGWRELDGEVGAMTYVITHSDQGKGKFLYNGITMRLGIPEIKEGKPARRNFERGYQKFKKWFDSDVSGAPEYAHPDRAKGGMMIYGLPIRPSLLFPGISDRPHLIKRMSANPTSTNWNGVNDPIGAFLGDNPQKKVHISEGPLIDDAATKSQGHQVKGVFTIAGEDIPIKSVFGGSGMYDTGKHLYEPFRQLAIPIGLASLIGYKTYDRTKE